MLRIEANPVFFSPFGFPKILGNLKCPAKELAHGRNTEAKDGHCYLHSELQDADLHKTQHKVGGY